MQWEKEIKVQLSSIQEASGSRTLSAIPKTCTSMEFQHIGSDYAGLLLTSSHSLGNILEQMGGSPSSVETLSSFEQALVRRFFSLITEMLSESLKDTPQFTLKATASPHQPKGKWPSQICMNAHLQMKWGTNTSSIHILLSKNLGKMIASLLREHPAPSIYPLDLTDVKIPLTALLGKLTLKKKELSTLNEGDILLLDHRVDTPIPIESHGKRAFVGSIGSQNMRKGVQIEWISPEGTYQS